MRIASRARPFLRRGAALLATAALSATTLGTLPAEAAADTRPAGLAVDWVVAQLTDGLSVGTYGPDIGLSIDAGLALEALGRDDAAAAVADAIGPGLVTTAPGEFGYVTSTEYDWEDGSELYVGRYANATAKAAAFVQRLGRDGATAYADVDLIAQLEELTLDSGRISDDSSYEDDFANTIGQAFAVEALSVAGSTEAAAATDSLLAQQCPAGYFRFALATTPCADPADAAHPDVTALAVLSLVRSGSLADDVRQAIVRAADWLQASQKVDGSFGGEVTTAGSNANTTGLAGWALGIAGRAEPAVRAASWSRGLQAADAGACATPLSAETGAIAYDSTSQGAARKDGITSNQRDQWRRTTFQAAPVLDWAPPATSALAITAPASAAESSTVQVSLHGLAAGETGCVSLGTQGRSVTGTGEPMVLSFDLPAGAATHTFTLETLTGSKRAVTIATASSTPAPTSPAPTLAPNAPVVKPAVGLLKVRKVAKVRRNRVALKVVCQEGTTCDARLVLATAHKVKLRPTARARKLRIARKSYSISAGETRRVVLRLSKPARKELAAGRLKVKAVQTAPGVRRTVTKFWLRRAR